MVEKATIIELRKKGLSYAKIGAAVGCSAQYAHYIAKRVNAPTVGAECIFGGLKRWLDKNGVKICKLCTLLYGAACGDRIRWLRRKLEGRTMWNKKEIDRILEITGLTYEEAFADGN